MTLKKIGHNIEQRHVTYINLHHNLNVNSRSIHFLYSFMNGHVCLGL